MPSSNAVHSHGHPDSASVSSGEAEAPSRLFLALWPPEWVQGALVELAVELAAETGGKPARTENVHLTLAFLGAVHSVTRGALERAIDATLARAAFAPFTLTLDRVGSFGGGIVWAGATAVPPELASLQQAVADCVRAQSIPLDARPFAVHLTLLRKARARVRRSLPPIAWPVEAFRLVASTVTRDGARYACVREWRLGS